MKNIINYIKKYKLNVCIILVLVIISVIIDLITPNIMSNLVEMGIKNNDINTVNSIGITVGIIAIISLLTALISNILVSKFVFKLSKDMRKDLINSVSNLSIDKIEKISIPSILTRLTNDVNKLATLIMFTILLGVKSPILIFGSFYMLFRISNVMSWYLIGAILVIVIIMSGIFKIISPLFKKIQESIDKINLVIRENVKFIRVIKTYSLEEKENNKFKAANESYKKVVVDAVIKMNIIVPVITVLINIIAFGVVLKSGDLIHKNQMNSGDMLAFLNYTMQILGTVGMIGFLGSQFASGMASSKRIDEVLNEVSSIKEKNNSLNTINNASIEFKNVSFEYIEEDKKEENNILNNISFSIENGKSLGIIGATGSGKTTLAKLLVRLYDTTNGEILIGNTNIKDYSLETLGNEIAYVEQSAKLISGTVKDNLTLGNKSATIEEINDALRKAQAYDFIHNYEDNINHEVLVDGKNFSGGQKQRLSIARALLKKSKILILDNATSALDYKTERKIQEAIKDLGNDELTTIIVSQRISSIKNCDKILVLENGKITSSGTHDEVLKSSEFYQNIYKQQGGGTYE